MAAVLAAEKTADESIALPFVLSVTRFDLSVYLVIVKMQGMP
jgi:hypothetical protein